MKEKVTIYDVASVANVSIATVSRVKNHKGAVSRSTFQRVQAAMIETGYLPTSAKQTAEMASTILVILPDVDNPFYSEIVRGIYSAASRNGYQILLRQSRLGKSPSLESLKELCLATSASGILFLDNLRAEIRQKLEKTVAIVQCCENNLEDETGSYVTIDDFSASKGVVNYLISRNRKRIALINGPTDFKYSKERYRGYVSALEAAGLPVNENHIANIPDISFEPVISVVTQMMSSENRPDAIFAASDTFGVASIKAITAYGLSVPGDVSVVGFDNTNISQLCNPPLTTVNQPKFQLGSCACEILMDKIHNPETPDRQLVLGTELIVREST